MTQANGGPHKSLSHGFHGHDFHCLIRTTLTMRWEIGLQEIGSTMDEVGEGEGLHGLADEVGSTRWAPGITFTRSLKEHVHEDLGLGKRWAPGDVLHRGRGRRGRRAPLKKNSSLESWF